MTNGNRDDTTEPGECNHVPLKTIGTIAGGFYRPNDSPDPTPSGRGPLTPTWDAYGELHADRIESLPVPGTRYTFTVNRDAERFPLDAKGELIDVLVRLAVRALEVPTIPDGLRTDIKRTLDGVVIRGENRENARTRKLIDGCGPIESIAGEQG